MTGSRDYRFRFGHSPAATYAIRPAQSAPAPLEPPTPYIHRLDGGNYWSWLRHPLGICFALGRDCGTLKESIPAISHCSSPARAAPPNPRREEGKNWPMSVSIPAFWNLLEESRLLSVEQTRQLTGEFSQVKGAADQGNAKSLAEWLVARNILSRYQSTIFLAGRSGPFLYGDYNVYDRVDRGRLAGQFRALHRATGHPVMLQFLTGPVIQDPQLWAVAAHETLAACLIQSPHVVRYFEPVDLVSFKFLVSEDLRGGTVEDRLAGGRLPPHEAARLIRLAAIGLAQMHQAGRVHGDLRPANLWLENAGQQAGNLKLLFAPQEAPGPVNFAQQDGKLAALADYLAPELMQPGKVPDPLTDIYALGCALYCLLSGSPPFAGGNSQQKMVRHANEAIRPLEPFGVPPPLGQLVAYMMAKQPAVRYQAAGIVAEQLSPWIDPALAYWQPPAPPPTLSNYENWVRQKSAQLAAQATPQPKIEAAAPAINLNLKLGGVAKSAPASGAVPVGVAISADTSTSRGGGSLSPEEYAARNAKRQQQTLIYSLVGAGVLAISALIAINTLGGKKTDDKVAKKPAEETPETPPDEAIVDSPTATHEVAGTKLPGVTPDPKSLEKKNGGGKKKGRDPASASGAKGDPASVAAPEVVADPEGKLLWASPTSGKPLTLRCVPPVGQVYITVRPAAMLAVGEGERVLHALGPTFKTQRGMFETASGFKLAEIEQLTLTLHNNDAKFPRASLVVRTKEAFQPEQLLEKWGQPAPQKEGNATYYTGKDWAFYIATAPEDERTFVMGDAVDIKEVAKSGGGPPLLARDMHRLLLLTDADRHVTILFNPPFFFNDDGEPLFAAERQKVREPLSWFLGDGLKSAAVSMQFGDSFYWEMRMLGSLDKEPFKLATELRERLQVIPKSLEDYVDKITPSSYWSKLSRRYPLMVNALHTNLRVGVDHDTALVNGYLEGPAAHSLALGGELLLVSAPGAGGGQTATAKPLGPKTIEEAMQLKTSFSFAQQSLEFAMRDLAEDVKTNLTKGSSVDFAIKIIGPDLQLDGITRNQSIRDFAQDNQSVADILTALCRKANPDPSAKQASDLTQKLIWVIAADPDNKDKQIVLITTRAAAEKKKFTLPAVFQLKK